jgi:RimJ/RimL family protein N-acetyltransferase
MHIAAPTMLVTKHLAVRAMTSGDIPLVCPRITFACIAEMSPWGTDFREPAEMAKHLKGTHIVLRNRECIGMIFSNRRTRALGIWIAPDHRKRGYAAEAVGAFLSHPRFRRIRHAGCFEDNIASRKLIERNGFTEIHREMLQSPFCPEPRIAVFFRRRAPRRVVLPLRSIARYVASLGRLCPSLLGRAMGRFSSIIRD